MTALAPDRTRENSWFRMQASAVKPETTDILIYDEIGTYGITALDFTQSLRAITTPAITLRLNTPGGDVFDGLAIYNSLKSLNAVVHVQVDGVAASIGSVIAMAGHTITMGQSAFLMVHNPWSLVIGNAQDMRTMADTLDKIAGSLAGIYATRASVTLDQALAWMNAETWFTGADAKAAGLADTVLGDTTQALAQARAFDLTSYRNVPAALHAASPAPVSTVEPHPIPAPMDCSRRRQHRLALVERGELSHAL